MYDSSGDITLGYRKHVSSVFIYFNKVTEVHLLISKSGPEIVK